MNINEQALIVDYEVTQNTNTCNSCSIIYNLNIRHQLVFQQYFRMCQVCVLSSRWPFLSEEVADHTPHTVFRSNLNSTAAPKRSECTGACQQNTGRYRKWHCIEHSAVFSESNNYTNTILNQSP